MIKYQQHADSQQHTVKDTWERRVAVNFSITDCFIFSNVTKIATKLWKKSNYDNYPQLKHRETIKLSALNNSTSHFALHYETSSMLCHFFPFKETTSQQSL